jgi:ribonucleoside-diphosphate reductase alpha chain
MFEEKTKISPAAMNVLKQRYFMEGEKTWEDLTDRVVNFVLSDVKDKEQVEETREMIRNRYFIPNSPCLVNAGKKGSGLLACFVVDFPDTTEGIVATIGNFFYIARKGGGCGTTLSHLRPKGSKVNGSSHGYAGGPIAFADVVSHAMNAITQSGFRSMAIMLTMSVYHPDIKEFIVAKSEEGKIANANMSVTVDDAFMRKVENDEEYQTHFHEQLGPKYKARDIFNMIVEGAWKNGEPGLLFYERMNDSPYRYSNQEIEATNPCAEQPLPANGCCNLGSLDISKFLDDENKLDSSKLNIAVRLAVNFLNQVVIKTDYPTPEIKQWSMDNMPIGLGIMGFADYLLKTEIAYGSQESLDVLEYIMQSIYNIAEDESIKLGNELGIPANNLKLPVQRRNVTLTTIAPTGTVSTIAGCSSSIEPIFSEITRRTDRTGTYRLISKWVDKPYFRCAVSANGSTEVTWMEHLQILNSAQKYVDSGVSKTINCPTMTHRDTVYDIFMTAWKMPYIKGLTIYRNQSRKEEVLSPKNLKKDLCPKCSSPIEEIDEKKKCTNPECDFVYSN